MKAEYVNPFIEASQNVLKQVVGLDARLGKIYLKDSPYKSDDVMVIVGVTGKIRGQVIFTMGKKVATGIASSMMGGMPVPELDEISKSAISELTNMILGNTATLLYNKGIGVDITPPSFLTGENMEVSQNKIRTLCIPLILSNMETIEIDVALENV